MKTNEVIEKLPWINGAATRRKLDKLLVTLEENAKKENFWNTVRTLTKNVHSDRSLREWQVIAESVYDILFKDSEEELAK